MSNPIILILVSLGAVIAVGGCATTSKADSLTSCPGPNYDRQALDDLKETGFILNDDEDADALALALADCLSNPDPAIRDGIAYEGIFALLRGARVSDETKRTLLSHLSKMLSSDTPDELGFSKPFAALALSEVARADRIKPYLTQIEREQLVETGVAYLSSVDDYRGFDEEQGWRHGVAHGADLVMQLALNENVGVSEHRLILSAIASQVAPNDTFYIYSEPERLARPVIFIAARNSLTEEEWTAWFNSIVDPAPLSAWSDAYSSNAGLAKRHNTYGFLSTLYLNVSASNNEGVKAMLPGLLAALKNLP